jgi:hypothetical protein
VDFEGFYWIFQDITGSQTGGWGGIRTHGTVARTPVFKTGSFNRSDTHPLVCCVQSMIRDLPDWEVLRKQLIFLRICLPY